MLTRINNFVFYLIILFLPFTSVYLFPSIFRGWSNNLSMLFFYIALFILFFKILFKKMVQIDSYIKKIIIELSIYLSIFFFITIVMNWYLVLFVNIHIFPDGKIPIYSIKIMIPFTIFIAVVYFIINFNSIYKLKKFIQLSLITFFLIEIYGYLQIYTLFVHNGLFYKFYIFCESFLDKGWGGRNYELFHGYPYSISLFRLNLLTPEASEAGHYILTYIYPFLLSSFITNYSVFKIRILFFKLETILFLMSLPLLIFTFSTSAYFVFLILFFITFIIFLFKNRSNLVNKLIYLSLFLAIFILLIFIVEENYEIILPIFNKLFNTHNGSTHTRLYGIIGGLIIFFSHPLGIGFGNIRYIFYDYLPKPLNFEQMQEYMTGVAFQPKSMFIIYLDSFGLIGLIIAYYFFFKIYKNLKKIKNFSIFSTYIYYSFILFFISFFLESFNSSTFSFLWIWALISFFIAASNINLYKKEKIAKINNRL